MGKREKNNRPSAAFKIGAVSFVFMIIGYQAALFVHRAARLRIESLRDHPDTVFVVDDSLARRILGGSAAMAGESDPRQRTGSGPALTQRSDGNGSAPMDGSGARPPLVIRRDAEHTEPVKAVREATRKVESFRFNPNTVSVPELQRLGFSEKQALAIENYREKGGRFRRKSDFAKSFVVADSVYERLEPFIDIPLVDINAADSAAFDTLPGIGGWFASKMVEYRAELGGYSCTEQLMDIYHFDRGKFDGLKDLVCCGNPKRDFGLWTLPAEELRKHPYIRSWQTARSIVFFRENNPRSGWKVEALAEAGIITPETAAKLKWCTGE